LAYDPNFTGGRKYDVAKAKQLLAEAGYPDGLDTKIILQIDTAPKDVALAVQESFAKAGIRAPLDFHQMGEYTTNYTGPNGNWPKGTMIFQPQPRFDKNFLGGIQFIANITGKSWLRTPEWTKAYNAALAAPAPDINLIRAVTDTIMRDASLIPVTELGTFFVQKPYVHLEYDQRAFMALQNWEDVWLNK
jgi:ABC-type transport system substrate-binding protein